MRHPRKKDPRESKDASPTPDELAAHNAVDPVVHAKAMNDLRSDAAEARVARPMVSEENSGQLEGVVDGAPLGHETGRATRSRQAG